MTKIRVILKKTMPLAVRLYVIGRGKALEISVALADSPKASRMKRFFQILCRGEILREIPIKYMKIIVHGD